MDFFQRHPTRDPDRIQILLGVLCDELQESLGSRLHSVIVYGNLVRSGHLEGDRDHVHLLIVVDDPTSGLLDRMAGPLRKAERELSLTTMTLTEEDLRTSADVFPIKFHAMQQHHRLLVGTDVLSQLEISDDHLRLRCEQQLKNLMLRMRAIYLHRNDDPAGLASALIEANRDLMMDARACLALRTGIVPVDDADVISQFGQQFGLDCQVLHSLCELSSPVGKGADFDLKILFDRFLLLTREAAMVLDEMEVS